MTTPATLVLADGTTFSGVAIGKEGQAVGEISFNTAMIGYQEVLTDPASAGQLITFTYPHIGNTGINQEDHQSDRVEAAGLIIRDLPLLASNFRSEERLDEFLIRQGIVGIAGIDTRRLMRHLRMNGSQAGCIVTGENTDIAAAKEMAQKTRLTAGSAERAGQTYEWQQSLWQLGKGFGTDTEMPLHVVAIDFGGTKEPLRHFVENGCRVTVVPAMTAAQEILALSPNGLFLSNGPGNPEDYATYCGEINQLLASKIPLFATGLGHQLLGLTVGARVVPLAQSYRGSNHPVQDVASGKVMMTTQSQSYGLVAESLPENIAVTHYSLTDQTVQGVCFKDQVAYSFQGYPEGDAVLLFDQLIDAMWTK